ncbi:hypothetical protein Droror1_Dr00004211 [Drosera rotundifolia]
MADEFVRPLKRRRRRKEKTKMKLLVGDKVEIRNLEDGFLGSWNAGTVTACESGVRQIRYDHLLANNGSEPLTDYIRVYSHIDGNDANEESMGYFRGRIRPVPPLIESEMIIQYGMCVDVYHNDAWWEGVVLDQNDNSEDKTIFFPDQGDEMIVNVKNLRISIDWNEITDEWAPRGKWLFLEVVREYAQDTFIPVSERQIWYDARSNAKTEQYVEWTHPAKSLWQSLIAETLNVHTDLFLDEFLKSCDFLEYNTGNSETKSVLECNSNMKSDHAAAGAVESCPSATGLLSPCPSPLTVVPFSRDGVGVQDQAFTGISNSSCSKKRRSKFQNSINWHPACPDIIPGAECCPSSVSDYSSVKKAGPDAVMKLRKHLLYLGFQIEHAMMDVGNSRFRYTSPNGKYCYSLLEVCRQMNQLGVGEFCPPSEHVAGGLELSLVSKNPANPDRFDPNYCPEAINRSLNWCPAYPHIISGAECCPSSVSDFISAKKAGLVVVTKLRKHLLYLGFKIDHVMDEATSRFRYTSPNGIPCYSLREVCRRMNQLGVEGFCPPSEHTAVSLKLSLASKTPASPDRVDSKYCPEAVSRYLRFESTNKKQDHRLLQKQVRNHLAAVGWRLWHQERNGKLEWRYTSPEKKTYYSLQTACESSVAVENICNSHPISAPIGDVPPAEDMFNCGIASCLSKPQAASVNSGKRMACDGPKRVLRSTRRARLVVSPNSSHRNPRTILSWLIDNNVVLPRAKVYYKGQKDHKPMAEGRITRDGIKCSCCHKVFSLSHFEVHAGSKRHKPSANIYVEDGRSLVECQMQVIRDSDKGFSTGSIDSGRKKQHKNSDNDYICSVCHYGGQLILCDRCPSSFHASCLNLEDIPDGDWFCPSCCCGICHRSQFDGKAEQVTHKNMIFCHQCEHQYHVGCLKDIEMIKLDFSPSASWFCSKTCQKIFSGLQELIGQPIPMGTDDLTWSLMKPIQYDRDQLDDATTLVVAENYSKLNVALEVMHECFEPVKEPRTKSDIVEDVIFSRSSELNRLNFRGFYTVLLERNDELISVACVRVFGGKVAEVPLVGTRLQFRRHGMCRILMNELEKRLFDLGVERLILPAVPSVVNAWTMGFGFSQMTKSERSEFLAYTFLDFQDTVMCQKLLQPPSRVIDKCLLNCSSSLNFSYRHSALILRQPRDNGNGSSCNTEDVSDRAISGVPQGEKTEKSVTVHQDRLAIVEVDCDGPSHGPLTPIVEVTEMSSLDPICRRDCMTVDHDSSVEHPDENAQNKDASELHQDRLPLKCYRRKKASLGIRPMPPSGFPNVEVSCR